MFLTWRLYGSLPPNRSFPAAGIASGKAFAVLDRLLDESRTGPLYLRQPMIADMVVEVIHHNAEVLGRYKLHAFAVMPNHVHVLLSPNIALSRITKALKGFTAKRPNEMLARTGNSFWQEESYDHLVRDRAEWERIEFYIEQNPVGAGLVKEAGSIGGRARGGRPGGPPYREGVDLR